MVSNAEHFASSSIQEHLWLIKYLETGELDARLEVLPSPEDATKIERLSRPELAVLLCYSKNSVYNMIIREKCLKRAVFLPYLLGYFPEKLKKEFKEEILAHKLSKYITASSLANNFVNFLGIKYFHQLMWDGQYRIFDILKAFTIVDQSIDMEHIFNALYKETNLREDEKMLYFRQVRHFIVMGIEYLLRSGLTSSPEDKIELYKEFFQKLEKRSSENLSNDKKLNMLLGYFKDVGNVFSIIDLAEELKMPFSKILTEFKKVADLLHTGWLQKIASEYKKEEQVGKIAVKSLLFEISDLHILLTKEFISGKLSLNSVGIKDYVSFIEYVKSVDMSDPISVCVTAVRKLRGIYDKGN